VEKLTNLYNAWAKTLNWNQTTNTKKQTLKTTINIHTTTNVQKTNKNHQKYQQRHPKIIHNENGQQQNRYHAILNPNQHSLTINR